MLVVVTVCPILGVPARCSVVVLGMGSGLAHGRSCSAFAKAAGAWLRQLARSQCGTAAEERRCSRAEANVEGAWNCGRREVAPFVCQAPQYLLIRTA